jgi:hypothetical protein
LRNYREKMEEIKIDASMHACVSLCQRVSSYVRCNYVERPARGKVFMR